MISLQKLSKVRNIQNPIALGLRILRQSSTKADSEEKIVIPDRIQRSPTDILRALASTVGNDPTAAHYKYHDDPYLIPMSNIGKRTFALAQEAGRKAARWVRQENTKLFQHKEAQPPVEAFIPQMVFTEESEVDETNLQKLIQDAQVSDAAFVYKLMKSKGIPVSDDLKQDLLELVCFYNHEDTLDPEYIEERWFKQGTVGKERQRKTWKDAELGEELFTEIDPKTSRSYAAIIRGMCKYFQVERAWALFQEAWDKGIELDTKTFNALLAVGSFLRESGDLRWELCEELLGKMNEKNMSPDLGTLNAALTSVSTIGNHKLARTASLKLLAEFKSLGIEPSLGTWYFILINFCRERGPLSHVLVDILNEIEGKNFTISDPKDTYFFVTAMDICRNHLHDKTLAKRVDKLLHYGNNYDLIGDSFKESIYYRNFFALLCQTEPLNIFMRTYDLLVPNIYIPEPGIMEEILKAVDASGALELIPKMWSDMVIFDHTGRESLINRILSMMVENKPSPDIESHQGLNEKFAVIAWDIFTKINEQFEGRGQKLSFTAPMLSQILLLLSRTGDFEKANEVFNKMDKNQHQIPGTASQPALTEFMDLCITEKLPSRAIACLEYYTENAFSEPPTLAGRIVDAFTLDESQVLKISSIVGENVLRK